MLTFSREFISHGIRSYAKDVATRQLGRISSVENQLKYVKTLYSQGPARIDFDIKRSIAMSKSGAWVVKKKYEHLPQWKRDLLKKRLNILADRHIGINKTVRGTYKVEDYQWMQNLRLREKLLPYATLLATTPIEPVIDAKRTALTDYEGTLLDKRLLDEQVGRVSMIVKEKSTGRLHFHEQTMEYSQFQQLKAGAAITIGPQHMPRLAEQGAQRYRLQKIKELDGRKFMPTRSRER